MEYSLSKIIGVGKQYIKHHILSKLNNEFSFTTIVIELNDINLTRITKDINDDDIESILWCDFHEKSQDAIHTVSEWKKMQDSFITDKKIPVSNFTYYYGVKNNKLMFGKLTDLDDDIFVIPCRNLKRNIITPFNKIECGSVGSSYKFTNENGEIYEMKNYAGGECKFIMVSLDGNSLFVSNLYRTCKDEYNFVTEWIKAHPSFPILIDNGRYLNVLFGKDATKKAFLEGGFATEEELYIVGTKKP